MITSSLGYCNRKAAAYNSNNNTILQPRSEQKEEKDTDLTEKAPNSKVVNIGQIPNCNYTFSDIKLEPPCVLCRSYTFIEWEVEFVKIRSLFSI